MSRTAREQSPPSKEGGRLARYSEVEERLLDGTDAELLKRLEEVAELLHDSDEVMDAKGAAEFLKMGLAGFNKIAPNLPRSRISENRYVYLRRDLISWLEAKREAPSWWYRS